ncbi:hypothetical protein OFN56_28520, partial [Escherichia coli]|nr:hypothetical protein [Escherichia coli]
RCVATFWFFRCPLVLLERAIEIFCWSSHKQLIKSAIYKIFWRYEYEKASDVSRVSGIINGVCDVPNSRI